MKNPKAHRAALLDAEICESLTPFVSGQPSIRRPKQLKCVELNDLAIEIRDDSPNLGPEPVRSQVVYFLQQIVLAIVGISSLTVDPRKDEVDSSSNFRLSKVNQYFLVRPFAATISDHGGSLQDLGLPFALSRNA